jgi:hypothetical protein
MATEFADYSLKILPAALAQRTKLPPQVLATLDDIIFDLSTDPHRHPDRVVAASRDGKSFVYMHPSPLIQVTFEIDATAKILYVINLAAPGFETKKTIFLSYSHKDEEWLQMLKKFLTVLEQQGIIELWDDSKIEAGVAWREAIEKSLDSCKAAILLVSQDFLTSDFIARVELPRLLADAEKQGKKVYWIPVRASTVFDSHKEITRFQSLLRDPSTPLGALTKSKREQALVEISKKLSTVASRPSAS